MHFLKFLTCGAMSYFMQDNFRFLKPLCRKFYVSPLYIIIMGISGAIFAMLDLMNMAKKPILSKGMTGSRVNTEKIISKATERDLRFIVTVLTIEFCLLVAYAALTGSSTSAYPWIILQSFVITAETLLFIIRFIKDGNEACGITRWNLLLPAFALFNWLQVFCHIRRQLFFCNY